MLPGIAVLFGYRREWMRGDLLAGVTVAAYLVPQVMAYAGLAGLPPVTGLWAILAPLVLYAALGSSRQLSVGPESTTALMTATVVGPLAAGDQGRYAVLATALAVTVGLLYLLAWAARLGFVAELLSRPVLIGYMAGVALTMIVDQLSRLTGVPVSGQEFVPQLLSFARHLAWLSPVVTAFAASALLILFVVQRYRRTVPGPLLVVGLGTVTVTAFGLDRHGIAVIGIVPAGLPGLAFPGLGDLSDLVLPALGVLLVGYTDVILTARAFATRGGQTLDPNQELLALGASNLGAGVLHGFPVSSSASRTVLGDTAGSRTQAYALVAFMAVLAVLIFLSPLLSHIPSAVLGAIVVYAAVRLIDLPGFRQLGKFRRRELLLALGCVAGVLALGILYGVLAAVGMSVAEMLSRVARPHDAIEGIVPRVAGMHDVDDYPQARMVPGLVVYRYDSPLFFANAEDFRRRALAAVDRLPGPVHWFVLNTEANVEVDITALDTLDAVRQELGRRGIVFALARVKQDLRDSLDAYGLSASIGPDRMFPTLPTAVAAYRDWHRLNPPGSG